MKKVINAVAGTVTFTFEGLAPVVLDVEKMSDATRTYGLLHGMSARIGDNAARSRKQPDGSIVNVTEEMRRADVLELVAHYESGTEAWELRTSRAAPQNPVILGIAAKRGCTYAEAEAFLAEQFLSDVAAA